MLRDQVRRSLFLIAYFRVLMNIPAPVDYLLFDCCGALVNLDLQHASVL